MLNLKDYPQLELIHIVKELAAFISLNDHGNVFAQMMDYDIQTETVKALAREHHCGYYIALVTLILERNLRDELQHVSQPHHLECQCEACADKLSPVPPEQPSVLAAAPDQYHIVWMERDVTKNSASSMWRCMTDTGERVNVFDHIDKNKDTFHFFVEAGYEYPMLEMKLKDVQQWNTHPIIVSMSKKGEWWEIKSVLKRPVGAIPDEPTQTPDATAARNAVIQWAGEQLLRKPNIFDTETTGVGEDDEIVRICMLSHEGDILIDQLIQPSEEGLRRLTQKDPQRGIAPQDIHGITPEMLKNAPRYDAVRDKIWHLLRAAPNLAFNADYDVRMLHQEELWWSDLHQSITMNVVDAECVMKQYGAFAGEWNALQKGWKWHKLEEACRREGLEILDAHDPVNDCRMTLALIKHMAAAKVAVNGAFPF